ncbi:MAG: flagellar motor protein [Bryobacteraceae bacterium]|nr:flagellar motor protein [Bryobacteraceae bacterium]
MAANRGGTEAGQARRSASRLDLATLGGLIVAFGGIVGGLILEGGAIGDITQPTGAMIVLGGTLGAVMVTTPLNVLLGAIKRLKIVFLEEIHSPAAVIEEIIEFATKARKNGIVSLEQDAESVQEPFLRKALNLAVDGTDLQEIRKMMELELTLEEQHAEAEAKVFESAGGYSPTIGIIGAVLGLIQVMKHIDQPSEVGHGIGVAFVATVYGLLLANVFLLPMGNKIKARVHSAIQIKELMLEGVIGIVEGLNPKLIRSKLDAYVHQSRPSKKAARNAAVRNAEASAET